MERDIFARLGKADAEKKAKLDALKQAQQQRMSGGAMPAPKSGSSFLDEWLAKRQQIGGSPQPSAGTPVGQAPVAAAPSTRPTISRMPEPAQMQQQSPSVQPALRSSEPSGQPVGASMHQQVPTAKPAQQQPQLTPPARPYMAPSANDDDAVIAPDLHLRPAADGSGSSDHEVSIKIR
ncbi:MAG: hypothetical protein ABIR91_05100 [Candidatus Saccharimonadales bacterium]